MQVVQVVQVMQVFAHGSERRAQGYLILALYPVLYAPSKKPISLFNCIYNHEMSLVPMHDAGERDFVAVQFPGQALTTGSETDALGSIADAQH
jgi:hypothetical protein